MMRVLAIFLRLLAAVFRLFPLRRRVAFLSRQSHVPSTDFRLLATRLKEDDPTLDVRISAIDSELSGRVQFALNMLTHLWLASTSRVVVLDGYNPAACIPRKRSGTYMVQLWHAAGAIKKFGYQCLDTPAGRTSEQARVACMHKNYDVIIAAGPGAIDAYADAFGYPKSAVQTPGLPHIEQLVGRLTNHEARHALEERYPWLADDRLNLLYAPTLRRGEDASWLTTAVGELARALSDTPVNLIVSKHPLTQIDESLLTQFKHVHVLSGHSTTALMPIADVMVTDYSAISLEAMLVDIPVLFYVPDIDRYRTSPGLNIDPISHPLLFGTDSAEQLGSALTDADRMSAIRHDCRTFAREYFKGVDTTLSTGRVAELIEKRLG